MPFLSLGNRLGAVIGAVGGGVGGEEIKIVSNLSNGPLPSIGSIR